MTIAGIRDWNVCKGGINKNFFQRFFMPALTIREMQILSNFDGFFNDARSQFNKPFSEPL
jgi:hypothetical protein